MSQRSYRQRRLARRRVVQGGAASAVGVVTLSLAGCAPAPAAPTAAPAASAPTTAPPAAAPTPTPAPTVVPTPAAKYGGTMNIRQVGQPPHLDVHQSADVQLTVQGAGMAYGRLLKAKMGPDVPSPSTILIGDFAESWTQPDDLTFLFKIRPGLKWHNIAPVNAREATAQDVVYSFQRMVDLKVQAANVVGFDKLEAVDKSTVRLVLAQPDADYLLGLASGNAKIVAKEAVDLKGDLKEGPTIGTGPWIFESWEKGGSTTLRRNPDYYTRGLPYLDKIVATPVLDDAARLAALRSGQLTQDAAVSKQIADSFKAAVPGAQVINSKSLIAGAALSIKCDQGPTSNVKVRQAIMKGINAQAHMDVAWEGIAWYSTGLNLPSIEWMLPEAEIRDFYKRDVAKAKQLLAEASQPNGFDLELVIGNYGDAYITQGEQMVNELKEIGVNLKLRVVTPTEWTPINVNGTYTGMTLGPIPTFPSVNAGLRAIYHSKGVRHSFKANDAQLDQLIEKQAVMTRDVEGRKKALLDLQRYILTQAFYWPPVGRYQINVYQPFVRNTFSGYGSLETDHYAYAWFDK
jgi:peptide/nickel transport system substrate-binding protein